MGSVNKDRAEDSESENPLVDALLVSFSNAFTMVFQSALDLNLFNIIGEGEGEGEHVSCSHIASQLSIQSPEAASRLDRVLRLLATHSLLTTSLHSRDDGSVERLYGLTPTTLFFAGGGGVSLSSVPALNNHRITTEVGFNGKDAIVGGGSQFKKRHGTSIFEYMDTDPTFANTFHQAMSQITIVTMSKVLEIYRGFEGLHSLVDVAGGTGICLNMIISMYPSIKAINFDLPQVINTAPFYPGIEHIGGDMFSGIPKADAIMIKDTLHNWNDDHCIEILKKCYDSLPNKGKVIVIGLMMPETPEATSASMFVSRIDYTMLMQAEGKERTEKEYEALCMASGFQNFRLVCVAQSIFAVMEFAKGMS